MNVTGLGATKLEGERLKGIVATELGIGSKFDFLQICRILETEWFIPKMRLRKLSG